MAHGTVQCGPRPDSKILLDKNVILFDDLICLSPKESVQKNAVPLTNIVLTLDLVSSSIIS